MAPNIYQNLRGQRKAKINVLLNNQTIVGFTNAMKDISQDFEGTGWRNYICLKHCPFKMAVVMTMIVVLHTHTRVRVYDQAT